MYWCRTLGELALFADRSATEPLVRSGKALAILTFVGLAPRRCDSRDKVVELFWPGTPLSHAHHNLRQALYRLRQAVPGEPLLRIDNSSLICSEHVAFDVTEGERALAGENFAAALELLEGLFLEGLSYPDAPEVEEWIETQRSRINECYSRAAEAVIEQSFASGKPEEALKVADQLRATNPLIEARVRPYIIALDRAGQTRRALAEYEAYRSLLASAVEDQPSVEQQHDAEELEASVLPWIENGSTVLPFVGRSAAWSTLLGEWRRAERGSCGIVLIEGDAGLGKTRVIEEFAARAQARGGVCLSGKCYEMEQTLPYAVVSHALRSAPGSMPTDTGRPGKSEGTRGTREPGLALRTDLVERIERLAGESAVLLACDDIHWADSESLKLLHFLTQDLAESRLLLLCTYRPAELNPFARRFALSVASEGLGKLIMLKPLGARDVEEILTTLGHFSDPDLAPRIAADLHRHTGGNPLFIAELLENLERRGELKLESGGWKIAPALDADALPKTLRKILADRVDGLGASSRFALEVMAAVADAASSALVAPILKLSEPQTELVLAELASARLLRRQPFGAFVVAHDELRQLVYAAIPDDRRREIHRAVGLALEEVGTAASPGGTARLARHFEQAGDAERARTHALAAANEAAELGATEARRSYLDLARAFEPGSLERGRASSKVSRLHFASRWLGYAVAILILGALLLISTRPDGTRGATSAPWHQGTVVLVQNEGTAFLPDGPYLRVIWPDVPGERATTAPFEARPKELEPRIAALVMEIEGGSHTKIFRIEGRDTIQLTSGPTDDGPALWSPDRTMLAVQRGWRVGDDYRFNLAMVDSAGVPLWPITDGPQQDFPLDWSPDGTRIAFNRNLGGRHNLWVVDVDGDRPVNLTGALGLPAQQTLHAVFSHTGNELTATQDNAQSIFVIDLQAQFVTRIPVRCSNVDAPAWSPDSQWLAVKCKKANELWLIVVSADGTSGPYPIAQLPAGAYDRTYWLGAAVHYVNDLRLTYPTGRPLLPVGEGVPLNVSARNSFGNPLEVPIRWSSPDSGVASVDPRGFVRGRKPGSARIVASAGGFRADTLVVQIVPAPIDTLLFEQWGSDIDTTRWWIVGSPLPEVLIGAGPKGASALLSNGDHNWPSGVMSLREFELEAGLTIELPVRFHFTGAHWQELELGLMHREKALLPGNERAPNAKVVWWNFIGTSPTYSEAFYSCRDGADSAPRVRTWDVDTANSDWHQLALQVRPDRYGECYLDGEFLGAFEIETSQWASRAILYLGGRSEGTTILHGPVLVTRGLRY